MRNNLGMIALLISHLLLRKLCLPFCTLDFSFEYTHFSSMFCVIPRACGMRSHPNLLLRIFVQILR